MAAAILPVARNEVEALRHYAPFDRMDGAALAFLAERLVARDYAAGNVITGPGTGSPPRLYIVERGTVQSEQPHLHDLVVEPYPTLGPGDCFPIGALLTDASVISIYRAVQPTRCLELDAPTFSELLRLSPPFQHHCVARLAALLQQTRARIRTQYTHLTSEQQSMASPLRAIVRGAPVSCAPDTPIREALATMRQARVGSIAIAAADGALVGIFTVQDLLDRVVLDNVTLSAPISTVMTPAPLTLSADASAYDASLAMAQHGKRHMPVIEEGRMIGMVSQRDLFAAQRLTLRQLPETITAANDAGALEQAARDIRQLARDMLANGVAAEHLTQFIASLNDRLTQRVLALELPRHPLSDIRLCWIALGSEGRLEQTFATDQDNGIIFTTPEGTTARAARERLLPFAAAVNHTLDHCGFPLCKGNIMAGNPRWCLSLKEWEAQFSAWIRNTDPEAVLNSAIFFDFRPVFGDASLTDRLRTWLLEITRATPRFLLQMAQCALSTRPPLGLVRDFVFDDSLEFPHTLDLKLYGLRPFVDAARINALRFAVAHTNTAQRLRLTAPALHLSADEVRAMVDGYYFIQLLRLRHQQFDPDGHRTPNRVDPGRLNRFDRRILKESFKQARELQLRLALDYPQ
ncbi:MAG: DUF294 nucleotidyltransferase-like domain-containing protein [Pseudomonadota bacterium]|nr:DUF294 nucleotidyltransferase-like domain-containing protein [Pseudomonadota bacterium]